jgi:hypothetical protein
MPLWLCLRFDQLSLEALRIATDDAVIVVASQRVLSCNDEAAAWGVRTGQSTQTAVGLLNVQPYQLLERSLEREQETLTQLESWGYSITPSVTRWREHCLQLEISGCLRLFGYCAVRSRTARCSLPSGRCQLQARCLAHQFFRLRDSDIHRAPARRAYRRFTPLFID